MQPLPVNTVTALEDSISYKRLDIYVSTDFGIALTFVVKDLVCPRKTFIAHSYHICTLKKA